MTALDFRPELLFQLFVLGSVVAALVTSASIKRK